MANRIIRGDILTSDRVNCLSAEAEVFYRRLMSVADDFGRYDGRLPILRSNLYPLRPEKVSDEDLAGWIKECVDSGSIEFYYVDNKPFVEIWNFGQTIRIKKAKYPENPNKPTARAQLLQTPVSICEQTYNTRTSGVETNPIQSGVETGVGVGLQKDFAPAPTLSPPSDKIWNDMPLPDDVPDIPPDGIITSAIKMVEVAQRVPITRKDALDYWEAWKVQHLSGQKHYKNLHDVHSHYINCIKGQRFNVKNIEDASRKQSLSPNTARLLEVSRSTSSGQSTTAGT